MQHVCKYVLIPFSPVVLWDIQMWCGEDVNLISRPPEIFSGTHFCGMLSKPQDHGAADRIM
jgi:hypothetical protein